MKFKDLFSLQTNEAYVNCENIFLLGEIEKNFDTEVLFCEVEPDTIEQGIHDVTFNDQPCILYVWNQNKDSSNVSNYGFICLQEDVEACTQARTTFNHNAQ